jgi:hypothetical protein
VVVFQEEEEEEDQLLVHKENDEFGFPVLGLD